MVVAGAVILVSTFFLPVAPAQAAAATCRGVRATIVGTSASEVIRGTAGRDVIAGLDGDDAIDARGGDDLVCGGLGADLLFGGGGDDRLYGGLDRHRYAEEDGWELVGDTLRGGPGDDRLDGGWDRRRAALVVPDRLAWIDSTHGVHIDMSTGTAHGQGADTFADGPVEIYGSLHGDVIDGSRRGDSIHPGPGNDVVRGGAGPDFIVVDDGQPGPAKERDRAWGGKGDDVINAWHGRNRLAGGAGDDYISDGGTGNDVLLGGSGDDGLVATVGAAAGPQRFDGGPGNDGIQVNTEGLNPQGAASTGTWNMATGVMTFTLDHTISVSVTHFERGILASDGTAWSVIGTPRDDVVTGDQDGTAPLEFDGLGGDDFFKGTDGDDVFDGGPGSDHSWGMFAGDDTCISVEVIDGSDCENVS